MAENTPPQKQIFLSYAWANVKVADEIDNTFKRIGITFRRDVRDIAFTDSIKEFMKSIGDSDFVVMLISDEYMKSENCMYEVTELFNTHEFEKRILPVIVNNAPVFRSDSHELYYDYWHQQVEEKKRLLAKHQNEKTIEDKKKVQSIYDYLGQFFHKISDLKSIHFDFLKVENYKPMLERIGLKPGDENVLERLLEIDRIEDTEDRELAFEKIDRQYPENMYVMFLRAYYAADREQYKKAKLYYQELLEKYPKIPDARVALGNILEDNFSDFDGAKKQYTLAIAMNPRNEDALFDLANLLEYEFEDYNNAKLLYERLLRINPLNSEVHSGYASLLEEYFDDFDGAKKYYLEAIRLDPKDGFTHFCLGCLLEDNFNEFIDAKRYYENTIELASDIEFVESAKERLANLIKTHFY